MKYYTLFILCVVCTIQSIAQDPSALLDLESSSQGVLVPRMSSIDRQQIADPADGLMVYDSTAQAFYYFNGIGWLELLSGHVSTIQDSDGDTKIQVEKNANDNMIRFDVNGVEYFRMRERRIEVFNTGRSIFIGEKSGLVDDATTNENVMIGYESGEKVTSGEDNVGIGAYSLSQNTTGSSNTGIGSSASAKNISGKENVAIGQFAMFDNETGNDNVVIGSGAMDYCDAAIFNNVAIGREAGFQVKGDGNIFIGNRAGKNKNGDNRLFIDNTSTATPLIYGELDSNVVRIHGDLDVTGSFPGSDNQTLSFNATNNNLNITNGNAVNLDQLELPIGSIMMWATATAPAGWVLCHGQNITAYPALVAVLNGNLAPDLRDKFPYGAGSNRPLGTTGSRESVTLTEANIPEHKHGSGTLKTTYKYKSNNSSAGSSSNKDGSDVQFYNGDAITGDTGAWGGSSGTTASFEIIPTFLSLNFIIKAE